MAERELVIPRAEIPPFVSVREAGTCTQGSDAGQDGGPRDVGLGKGSSDRMSAAS